MELGFAFIDDGKKIFKFNKKIIEDLSKTLPLNKIDVETKKIANSHPQIFCLFNDPNYASKSIRENEL